MVILDVRVDESSLAEDRSKNIVEAHAGVLQETYFDWPARLYINGIEMFEPITIQEKNLGSQVPSENTPSENREASKDMWLNVPVLDLAAVGLDYVTRACNGETVLYYLPGSGAYLKLQPDQDKIRVYLSNRRTAEVNCDELLQAFEEFADKVRHILIQGSSLNCNDTLIGENGFVVKIEIPALDYSSRH